jgi:chemosensory pili system protein ChpA (sensor histidine kinase/response regulator)
MVPFVQIVPRLHRLVRQTAQALNKRATLVVRGPEVELDRSILDRLGGPLEHLLRNAVAHGIETPRRREAAGKPAEGIVELVLSREGNDVIIALTDDGAGMDLAAIRRRAAERGLLQGGDLTEEELLQLAMEPGFSTVEQVTQIAGCGVGLDVVATEIKRLSGTLTLASESGKGAAFTMRLPLTLAMIDALLVTLGDVTYAVPHASIEGVARIPRADLDQCYSSLTQEFTYLGEDYRIMHLAGLLDPDTMPDLGERLWLPLLLVRTAEQRLALQVESLIGTQRIVVKPLESQFSGVRWLNGETILPDGRVATILDLLALARSTAAQAYRFLRTPSA